MMSRGTSKSGGSEGGRGASCKGFWVCRRIGQGLGHTRVCAYTMLAGLLFCQLLCPCTVLWPGRKRSRAPPLPMPRCPYPQEMGHPSVLLELPTGLASCLGQGWVRGAKYLVPAEFCCQPDLGTDTTLPWDTIQHAHPALALPAPSPYPGPCSRYSWSGHRAQETGRAQEARGCWKGQGELALDR